MSEQRPSKERLPLLEWVLERLENCQAIAEQKTGADREEWLEDADYFARLLRIVDAASVNHRRAVEALRDIAEECEYPACALSPAEIAKMARTALEGTADEPATSREIENALLYLRTVELACHARGDRGSVTYLGQVSELLRRLSAAGKNQPTSEQVGTSLPPRSRLFWHPDCGSCKAGHEPCEHGYHACCPECTAVTKSGGST